VEKRTAAHEVCVYESLVHLGGRRDVNLWLDMSLSARMCIHLRAFHTQRSFSWHTLGKVASCQALQAAQTERVLPAAGVARAPLSLRFSLSHPLFRVPVSSTAAAARGAGGAQFLLECQPERDVAPLLVGLVRLDCEMSSVRLAL